MYKKILVPVDLAEKEMTLLALEAALPIAKANEAELRLVNIQPVMPASWDDWLDDWLPPYSGDAMQDRRDLVGKIRAMAQDLNDAAVRQAAWKELDKTFGEFGRHLHDRSQIAEKGLIETEGRIDYPAPKLTSTFRFGGAWVYPEVLAEAEDWGADLIVVCSHRPTMATYLLGFNAKNIVRHARCSVLVARK